jgi:hypothetical protein
MNGGCAIRSGVRYGRTDRIGASSETRSLNGPAAELRRRSGRDDKISEENPKGYDAS